MLARTLAPDLWNVIAIPPTDEFVITVALVFMKTVTEFPVASSWALSAMELLLKMPFKTLIKRAPPKPDKFDDVVDVNEPFVTTYESRPDEESSATPPPHAARLSVSVAVRRILRMNFSTSLIPLAAAFCRYTLQTVLRYKP